MKRLFVLLLLFLISSKTYAYESLVYENSQRYNVPAELIFAIAKTESRNHLWAVNIAGKGYYPQSKEEALELIKIAKKYNKSYDIGIMQVNSQWLKKFNYPPEVIIEPHNNIMLGTWILASEIKRYGLNWKAIASYHTPIEKNPQRAKSYAYNVIKNIRR